MHEEVERYPLERTRAIVLHMGYCSRARSITLTRIILFSHTNCSRARAIVLTHVYCSSNFSIAMRAEATAWTMVFRSNCFFAGDG